KNPRWRTSSVTAPPRALRGGSPEASRRPDRQLFRSARIMERRWGARKAVEVDVVVDNQPACLRRGTIGDVSIGGVFVRMEPDGLTPESIIELVLLLQQDDGMKVYRMPAVVARVAPDGAGLRFDQYDVGTFRTLVMLLLALKRGAATGATRSVLPRSRARTPAVGNGETAPALEGTTGRVALAGGPLAPVSATSPVHGESH